MKYHSPQTMYTRSEIWKTVDEIIWKEVHSYERKFILSTIDDSFKVLTSFDEISFSANNVYTLRDLKNCGWNHMMLPFNWNLLCYLILGILKKTKLGFCELIFGLKGLISYENNYWRNATVKSTFGSNNCGKYRMPRKRVRPKIILSANWPIELRMSGL